MTAEPADVAQWFPPEQGPVLVIGNPSSVFTRHLATLWRSMGVDARLLTRRWRGARTIDDIPILVATDYESSRRARTYELVEHWVSKVERRVLSAQRDRYRRAMGSETSYHPVVSPSLADALGIARAVGEISPQFVCGQEVFSYGLATAFCRNTVRALMPWGGDIYMYAETSTLASMAVGHALRRVDLVVPGSSLALEHVHRRFRVPRGRMHIGGTWVLDRQLFRVRDAESRRHACERFGIPPSALVVMNIRRFFRAWGSDLALAAFVRFAKEHRTSHFVLLGGVGTESFVAAARETVRAAGLANRFTFFDGDIPLQDCAALMSISGIAVSLMREQDMRPLASILEAVSAGAAPILGDQPEYRDMERQGFRALFCAQDTEGDVVDALRTYAADAALREATVTRNEQYLDERENGREQATALLARIRGIRDNRIGRSA